MIIDSLVPFFSSFDFESLIDLLNYILLYVIFIFILLSSTFYGDFSFSSSTSSAYSAAILSSQAL